MTEQGSNGLRLATRALSSEIAVVTVAGILDGTRVKDVDGVFDQAFHKGVYKLAVDLSGLKYISSDGVGCFISSYVTAIKHGGRMVFVGLSPEIKNVFSLVGLTQILRFAGDLDSALKQLE